MVKIHNYSYCSGKIISVMCVDVRGAPLFLIRFLVVSARPLPRAQIERNFVPIQ